MPYVNLIESNLIGKRAQAMQSRTSKLALIGVSALMFIGWGLVAGKTAMLGIKEKDLNARISKLRPLIKSIEESKRLEADLSPRLTTLKDAQDLTAKWGAILDHITRNTPENAYYTAVRASQAAPDKGIQISITGICQAQTDAQEVVLRLQNAKDLEAVNLEGTAEKVLDKAYAIEFSIKGEIAGTAKKAEKVADEGAKV